MAKNDDVEVKKWVWEQHSVAIRDNNKYAVSFSIQAIRIIFAANVAVYFPSIAFVHSVKNNEINTINLDILSHALFQIYISMLLSVILIGFAYVVQYVYTLYGQECCEYSHNHPYVNCKKCLLYYFGKFIHVISIIIWISAVYEFFYGAYLLKNSIFP